MSEEARLQVVQLPNFPDDQHGSFEGLKLLPRGDGHRLLLWDDAQVYVFNFEDVRQLSFCIPTIFSFQGMWSAFENDYSEVIVLNRKGNLCIWREKISADEEDLFQESDPSPQQPKSLASNILAVTDSSLNNIFYTLSVDGENIKLVSSAVEMDILQEHSSLVLTQAASIDLNAVRHTTFLSVPSNSCSAELLSLLCPDMDMDENCDIVIISLNSSSIFFCPLVQIEQDRRVFEICTTVQSVLHITLAKEDCSSLLIFTANNVLVTLEPENGQLKRTELPCIRSQVVCQVSSDSFYLADPFGSSSFSLGHDVETLPIKGTIAAQFVDENQTLVLTLHGAIYLVDLSVPSVEDPVPDDPAEILESLARVNEEIKWANRAIKEENARLKEVSMVNSAGQLKDSFRLQAKVHDGNQPDTFILDVLVLNNSKHIFLEGNWNIEISLSGKDFYQAFSQRLQKTLKIAEAVKVVAEFKIPEPKYPLTLRCHFIKQLTVPSSTDLNSIELPSGIVCIEVATLDLDFTFFISPMSVDPVQEYRQGFPEEDNALMHTRIWETATDFESICRAISKNCSHRSFGAIRGANRATFKLGRSRVNLVYDQGRLSVSSTNFPLIFDIIGHLHSSPDVEDGDKDAEVTVDSMFFVQAENVGLALNYALLTDTCDEELETNLQSQLRKLVIAQFPFSND